MAKKHGQFAKSNMQNEKSQLEQLEMLSTSEYNIPVENRFSMLVDEGKKKDEQKTRRHKETHGITNDQDLNNTLQQQQQQLPIASSDNNDECKLQLM